ncbi:transposase [Streptococcus thermophilus]|uniref:transposase n=1 Tax=Streptococcus thermophilus TaxID=1308 RepID=UPI003A598F50
MSFPTRFSIAFIRQTSLSLLTKKIKHQTKKKVLFPNEEALERYLVSLFEDYNFKQNQRIHKGFGQCADTLESLFD